MTGLAVVPNTAPPIVTRDPESEKLIREQFGLQEATSLEIDYFFTVCQRLQLDPLQRQIYAIMRKDRRAGRKVLTIQVSIDGYRSIAARSDEYAGSDDAVFTGDNGRRGPARATVTVYRIVKGIRCPFTASALWDEYAQTTGQWPTKPYVMLAKCAEALALRKAFPAELGGTYTTDEIGDDTAIVDVPGLTDAQVATLKDLSEKAGVSEAVAAARIANMKPSDFEAGVERLNQRIAEQERAHAESADDAPCAACQSQGAIDGEACGDCGGTGLAS